VPESAIAAGPADLAISDLTISTRALTKDFAGQRVVDGIDLVVPTGAVYGFLGPNGSGKTTTIRMLLGLVAPTSGETTVLGHAVPDHAGDALRRVGALVEGPAFHPYLSGRGNLARLDAADLSGNPSTSRSRVEDALEHVGLLAAAGKRYRQYSLGMRQRLAIAGALLMPRELLVLDEPTNGLDPQGTREVRALISRLAADGATVLVSSHLLAEIEQICTHLGIISDGRLVAQGSVDEVKRTDLGAVDATVGPQRTVVVRTGDGPGTISVLTALGAVQVSVVDEVVTATLPPEVDVEAERVVKALVDAGIGVRGFELRRPTLEDVFVGLTGEGFDVHH